jgi:two-component system response regulator FixJ
MTPNEKPLDETVCLVDDDPAVLKSIARLLVSDGLAVRAFDRPKCFLDYARMNRVSLVVLDIWMEEMNGLEVQAQVGAFSPDTRVIIMTGRDDPAAKQAALRSGVFAFFTKPFDGDKFLGAVQMALALRIHGK